MNQQAKLALIRFSYFDFGFLGARRFAALIFLIICLAVGARAQQDSARLDGTVHDQQGAAVAGAAVKLSSSQLAVERTVTTSEQGTYSIPQLRPGVYVVAVTQNGFKTAKVENLEIGVGQTRTFDVTLELGAVDAIVDVTTSDLPATIDNSSARMGVNVSAREVNQLPVNGRTYSQLYLTAPGATNAGTGNANEIRFNGRSNQQNQVRYDGVESTAVFDASPGYVTVQGSQFRLQNSLETIQEFRIDSSVYPAEYGTGTGGQINVVGKQGTNDFRGSLYYYGRNDVFDARNFFDSSEASKLRLNQFGGSLGGRIVRDRLFFFASYEGLRQRAGFNVIELTPSNFVRDFINYYGTGDARGEAARAALGINSNDAASALTRIQNLRATGVVNAFPVGNGAPFGLGGVSDSVQFSQLNSTQRLDEDVFNVRIDGKINDRFNFFTRLNAPRGDIDSPDGTTGRRIVASQKPRNFVASVQQTYGASIFNETKFGINSSPTTLKTVFPSIGGVSGVDLSSAALRLGGNIVSPGVNGGSSTGIAEPGGLTRQSSAGNGRAQPVNGISYSLIDNLSVVRGDHTLKFGGEFRLNRVSFDQLGGTTLSYGNLRDFLLNQNLTAAYIGDLSAAGDFRIATNPITDFTRSQSGSAVAENRFYIAYGQDEWKVRPNVTLSYGLRYEYYSPVAEKNNRQIVFDAATGQILPPDTKLYQSNKNNLAPRFGFVWSPAFLRGKTVIRAGAGLFYGPGQFEDLIQPIESNVFRSSQTLASGLTGASVAAVADTSGVLTGFTPRAYDNRGYRVPERVGQYSVSVQQELFNNTVLTVAYVGSQGRNLFLRSITNRILPGQTVIASNQALPVGVGAVNRTSTVNGQTLVTNVTTVREFDVVGFGLTNGAVTANPTSRLQPFGEIDYKTGGGRDRFDSLQIKIDRRFVGGLALGGQYTLAKSFGNTQGSNEAQTAQNPYSFAEEFGNNTFDVRHSANATILYELPFGKNRRFDLGAIGNAFFGGWQIGGIYNGRSGTPLDIRITRADLAIQCAQAGGCPNGAGGIIAQGTTGRFFSPSASNPLPPGFVAVVNTPGGNASRNTRRPDLIAGVDPFLKNGADKLFFLNPAAFAIPAPGTYGNLPRNEFHGPNFHQFDLTLQKRFHLTERANVEFRTEVFNIFNRANFANPPVTLVEALPSITYNATSGVTSVGSGLQPGQPFNFNLVPNFGLINSTVGKTVGLGTSRQIQFALRLNF